MSRIPLAQCKKVFLDTTFIIDLLNVNSNDKRTHVVRKIAKFLSAPSLNVRFYISTISISEICEINPLIHGDDVLIDNIMDMLNGADIETVPFSEDIALHHRKIYRGFYPTAIQNNFITNNIPNSGNYAIAREWISKDMLIASTAHFKNVDVVFTGDDKTFLPIAKMVGLHCVITKEENFLYNIGGDLIYEFS